MSTDRLLTLRLPLAGAQNPDRVTHLLASAALFALAMFVVLLPPWLTDPRLFEGAPIFSKPQKFNLSMAVHFFTLALLAQQLPRAVRRGPILLTTSYLAVAAMLLEIIYITLQAARGRRSHFNFETGIEASMYAVMGVGAVTLIAAAVVLAILLWRRGQTDMPGYRWGSILGLITGFVVTGVVAGVQSSIGTHPADAHPSGGAVIPWIGWSREVGDLRPAHFVALHLMQTVPLIGYLADRRGLAAVPIVIVATLLQLVLAFALFAQALAGKALWPI
ncbi:MAG: hypothetical protein AAF358_23370 [Pseudomonadota bacterium]